MTLISLELDKFPPIYSQGKLGTCTSCAMAGMLGYKRDFDPSILFLNYNEAAHYMPACVAGFDQYGVCSTDLWPYTEDPSSKPSKEAYREAAKHWCNGQWISQSLESLLGTLQSDQPFVLGFNTYENFKPVDGVVPLPSGKVTGRHAVCCVGYDPDRQLFYFRNSWGSCWDPGFDGYFYMHYSFVLSKDCAFFFTVPH